jgi:hypothetical protein
MKYRIRVEWMTSKRGLRAFRSDPCLGTKQVEHLDEVIAEQVEEIFKGEYDDSLGHWGKAGRSYWWVTIFNDDAVSTFTEAVKKSVGPAIWDEFYSFEVTLKKTEADEDEEAA